MFGVLNGGWISERGIVYSVRAYQIPEGSRTSSGDPLVQVFRFIVASVGFGVLSECHCLCWSVRMLNLYLNLERLNFAPVLSFWPDCTSSSWRKNYITIACQ